MAKPLELVTEVSGKDAIKFLSNLKRPMTERNKDLVNRAKKLKYKVK